MHRSYKGIELICEKALSGRSYKTTNNRVEIKAIVEALNAFQENIHCAIEIYTDSQYAVNGISSWLPTWKKNNWLTSDNLPVKNRDLWERLDRAINRHGRVAAFWLRGHGEDKQNKIVDKLARQEAREATIKDGEDL